MKKLIYAAAMTLACVSSVPASLVGLSINSAALAAENSCSSINSGTTTGEAVRERLDVIARCNPSSQSSMTSLGQTKGVLPSVQNPNQQAKPSFCQTNFNSLTSGSSVREQLNTIARCNSLNQLSGTQEASFNQLKNVSPGATNPTLNKMSSQPDNTYPAFCPALPGGLKAGDFGFREALARCLYGS
ncbi:MAG: hypothetical protein WCA35_05560 [Kovacikia sp.]